MSSGQSPRRRRQSPAVYRRRRLVLLLGVILIAAVVWVLVAQPWRGWAAEPDAAQPKHSAAAVSTPGPSSSPTPAGTASDAPSPAPTEAAEPDPDPAPSVEPCLPRDLDVEALTDQDTYASGQNPQLSIRLTNTSPDDCTLNVGTSTQSFTIMSGTDVWWRSTDCQTEPSDMIVTLAAGQSVTSATPVVWDRTRSNVSTCDSDSRQHAPGGGASYHLTVEIAGVIATQTKQILLY